MSSAEIVTTVGIAAPLILGLIGWLIRLQGRVQSLEQSQTIIQLDLKDLKLESRGFRDGINSVNTKLEVMIQRLEDFMEREKQR